MQYGASSKLSVTKKAIIEKLFVYRALTSYQISFLLDPTNIPMTFPYYSWEQIDNPKMHSLYNQLKQLQQLGIVHVVAKHENNQRVFSLTDEGLSVAYCLLDIPEIEGYQRTGWDNNYGFFPYELYRPPKERLLKHHTLGIEFNVLLNLLSIKHGFSFDFIDNRYSSVDFTTIDKDTKKVVNKVFRPDGEFIIKTAEREYHCWVEFDMGTEKGNLLHGKFEKYNQFLSYMVDGVERSSLKTSLPDTIFFVTTASNNIWSRWQNIFRNYMNAMGSWSTYLNMIVGNLQNLENLILSHINEDFLYKQHLNANLYPLLTDPNFIGQPKPSSKLSNPSQVSSFCYIYEPEVKKLGWTPHLTITQTKANGSQVYVYVKFEEYETGGIAKAIDFFIKYKEIESMKKVNAFEVIPVLLFSENRPHSLQFLGCNEKDIFEKAFSKYLWHDVVTNKWYKQNGEEINTIKVNPLCIFTR